MNDFQYRLQKAIAASGLTASELSKLSGVGKSDISNYINGVYIAKQDKAYMLAKALGVDPGWLMTGDAPVNAADVTREDQERLEALHQNPRLGLLFDRTRKMSSADVETMLAVAASILKERDGE